MLNYVSKTGKIYVKTLTNSGEWYQILTVDQSRSIRAVWIKSRYTHGGSPKPFDLALNSTPTAGDDSSGTGYISNSGDGKWLQLGNVKGLWAKSIIAGTILEAMVFE